jgi:ATP-binding cassette, subfamily B, bacterial PglK
MLKALKKLNKLLDNKSKIQFGFLFTLLIIKSFLDGIGLGMIAPYIVAIGDSSIIFNHAIFQKINIYAKIDSSQQLIFGMSILLITFFIIKNIFSLYVMYYQSRLVFTKRSIQGRALLEAYMNAPYSYHLEHNTAELDRNIRFESINVYSFVQRFILLCSNVLLTISIFIVLMLANWQAVLILGLIITSFASLFLLFSGKYSKKLGLVVQESQLHLGQALKEGLSSIIEVQLHHIESFFPSRFFKAMMSNARANWRHATLDAAPTLFFEILAVGTMVGVIIVLAIRNMDLQSVLPILGLFSFAFIRLIPSVTVIIKCLQDIKFRIPAVDVVFADFQKINRLIKDNSYNSLSDQKAIEFKSLSLENLNFSFPSKNNVNDNVIDGISIMVKKGESIGITGPSGSGKTTLINMILGLLNPDSGQICVNDEKIQNNMYNWRSLIGYVPQSITLIDASIKENVALGLEGSNIDEVKVWSALEECNLVELVKSLPEQLDTCIGENGMRLSGGQRQRLGLARALYSNPEVIVFDEATSALDVETEKRITREVMKLSGKRTLIIVAHRISTIKDCDVIYYLKDGKIVNSGSFEELKDLNKDFRAIAVHSEVELA